MRLASKARGLGLICCSYLVAACSHLPVEDYEVYDPYEKFNRGSYVVSDVADKRLVTPVAKAYQYITPNWLERGIGNVFLNLRTISSSVNGFLQGKPKAGATDFARIVVNSTVGLGGFFDVASGWKLPYQNEDFGQTLAVWGVKKTRYIYVPFMGPTTVRDLPSTLLNSYLPSLVLGTEYHWSIGVLDVVSNRAELIRATEIRDASALDPYAFTRDAYFQRRKFLIYDGSPPIDDFFDDFDDLDDLDETDFNEAGEQAEQVEGTGEQILYRHGSDLNPRAIPVSTEEIYTQSLR